MKDFDRVVFANSFYAEVRVAVDGVAIEVPINQRKVNAISGRLGMVDKEIEAQKKAEAFLAKFPPKSQTD